MSSDAGDADDDVGGDLGPLFRLIYRSRTTIPAEHREAELGDIFHVARTRNALVAVTGALLAWRDAFVQVLEGDEDVVRGLYATIRADPRHADVALLDVDSVPDRVFARWSMARVGDGDGADLPVHRDGAGVVAVAPRLTSPRQDMMLDLMREYAHVDAAPR